MKSRIIAGAMVFSLVGGVAYGLTNSTSKRNASIPNLKEVKKKTETVTYYTLTVEKDGLKAEFPIVKIGDTYYGLPMKLINGSFEKVEPKISLVPVKAEFLKEAEKELKKANLSFTIKGSGKGKLYVIFDAFCPFCMRSAQSRKLDKLKEKYAEVTFLPLMVHGDASVRGLSCIYEKAKKEGIGKALREVFSWKEGRSWEEYKRKVESCSASPETEKAVENVSNLLVRNGVYATPTFFYFDGKNYYKRVGNPDFSGVKK